MRPIQNIFKSTVGFHHLFIFYSVLERNVLMNKICIKAFTTEIYQPKEGKKSTHTQNRKLTDRPRCWHLIERQYNILFLFRPNGSQKRFKKVIIKGLLFTSSSSEQPFKYHFGIKRSPTSATLLQERTNYVSYLPQLNFPLGLFNIF